MSAEIDDRAIAEAILALCAARGPEKTICPSEAARRLAPEGEEWRALMERTRRLGAELAATGRIDVTQKGAPVDPAAPVRGPVRFRLASERR